MKNDGLAVLKNDYGTFLNVEKTLIQPTFVCSLSRGLCLVLLVGSETTCQTVYANTGWKNHKCHKFSNKWKVQDLQL